jgi:hypothetical protein
MSSYFRNPQRGFSSNDGYDLAVWNLFLRDRFGVEIIKKIWELMPTRRALESFSEAIREAGSVFKVEFNKFGVWNYFTGPRAVAGMYYKEAANYPAITPGVLINSISVNSEAVSNNYLLYTGSSGSLLVSIISNCDISGGIKTSPGITSFTYTVSTGPVAGGRNILGNYYSKLESQADPSLSLFSQSNIFNNIPVNEGNIIADETDYPFPQPFRYSSGPEIFFPASLNGNGSADLNIYTIDMRLVFSGSKRIVTTDKIYVGWDAHDNSGKRLGTGVYIYVTKSGDTIKKGKFVIYND